VQHLGSCSLTVNCELCCPRCAAGPPLEFSKHRMADDAATADQQQRVRLPVAKVIEDVDADLEGLGNLQIMFCYSDIRQRTKNPSCQHSRLLVGHRLLLVLTCCANYVAGRPADERIAELNEHYQSYGLIEQQLLQRRARLSGKVPEIQKTLDALVMLQQRQQEEKEVQSQLQSLQSLH